MSPDVLRRKLQKYAKRKRNARCSACGGDAEVRHKAGDAFVTKRCAACGRVERRHFRRLLALRAGFPGNTPGPILADALEERGETDAGLLKALRT